MSNRLAELEQIHDALGYWDQEDYIEWLELSKAALEAELRVMNQSRDHYRHYMRNVYEYIVGEPPRDEAHGGDMAVVIGSYHRKALAAAQEEE